MHPDASHLVARPAAPADHPLVARLAPDLATGDPPPALDRWVAVSMPSTLVFSLGGDDVAYAWYEVLRGAGYVRHVVVDARVRGRGLGGAVMAAIAERLRAAGCARWELNVKPDNVPAIRLYERCGMRVVHPATALALEWSAANSLPDETGSFLARELAPADDDDAEAAFHLPAGILAHNRGLPGKHLRLLVAADAPAAPLGLAVFDPGFPGAYPFRLARPGLAAHLLGDLRRLARPEHTLVNLVVEDDRPLVDHRVRHGANVRLEILHMEGPVPPAPEDSPTLVE